MKTRILNIKIFLITVAVLFLGTPFSEIFGQDISSLLQEGDRLWAQRDETDKLTQCIACYEEVVKADPDNEKAFAKLSHAYCYMGLYVLTKESEKKEMFKKGIRAGEKATKINPNNIEGVYWLALNTGYLGDLSDVSTRVLVFPKIKKFMSTVKQIDPSYYYGGYDRFVGRALYKSPTFLLTIQKKSLGNKDSYTKEDQERFLLGAIKSEPNFFMKHVYLAESYLQLNKQALARKELEWVINTPEGLLPEAILENKYWTNEAKKLLEKCG